MQYFKSFSDVPCMNDYFSTFHINHLQNTSLFSILSLSILHLSSSLLSLFLVLSHNEEGVVVMDTEGDREVSPQDMEQSEGYDEEEDEVEKVEYEEEDIGPPPRPGRRVQFEPKDRLAVELQERDMHRRSK